MNNLYGLQKMSQMIRSERPVVVVTVSDLRVARQTKKVRTTRYTGRSDRVNVETAVMSVWFTLWASSIINALIISSICSVQYLGVSCQDGSYGTEDSYRRSRRASVGSKLPCRDVLYSTRRAEQLRGMCRALTVPEEL